MFQMAMSSFPQLYPGPRLGPDARICENVRRQTTIAQLQFRALSDDDSSAYASIIRKRISNHELSRFYPSHEYYIAMFRKGLNVGTAGAEH